MKRYYNLPGYIVIANLMASCAAPTLLATGAVALTKKMTAANTEAAQQNGHYMAAPTNLNDLVSAETADQYFEIGHRYQQQNNTEMAVVAYQKALHKDSGHTDSLSQLARIYAAEGKMQLALPLLERACFLQPSAKHYSNLGYAYYLNQQYDEAMRVLNQAIQIDPAYTQARNNLALVMTNVSADKTQAANPSTYVVVNDQQAQVALSEAVATPPAVQLETTGPSVYTLKMAPATEVAAASAGQPVRLAMSSGGVSLKQIDIVNRLLEAEPQYVVNLSSEQSHVQIVNANGVKGVAKSLANRLGEFGISQTSVRDGKRFNVAQTHIQYRPEFRDDALTLHYLFKTNPPLYRNDQLPAQMPIKLVLGKDIS